MSRVACVDDQHVPPVVRIDGDAAVPPAVVRPHAILFDWDNTLVDSWGTIHEALNAVMVAMDEPPWSLQATKERVRLSLRESFPLYFGDRWEEARRIYLDVFREIHLERLNPLPGRGELLRGLSQDGIFLGVVSNKTGSLLRREAERIGWSAQMWLPKPTIPPCRAFGPLLTGRV